MVNILLKQCGTAIGSSMAPAYVSLFMGKFEQNVP